MSEQQYEDEFDEQQQEQQEEQSANIRRLRENAKWAEKNRPVLTSLQRENAFLKAGIDVEDAKARYFVKGYDGDLERDAIRAAAAEIGLAEPPKQTESEIPPEEVEAHKRIQGTSTEQTAPVTGVTYQDFAEMDRSAQVSFLAQHPNAEDAWSQGRPHPVG